MSDNPEDHEIWNKLVQEWEECFATAQKYQHELMQSMHDENGVRTGQSPTLGPTLEQINKAVALWLLEKEAKAAMDGFVPTPPAPAQ